MLLKAAEAHFGGCKEIANLLASTTTRTVQAVYQWKKKGVVPLAAARRLSELSGGQLSVDENCYDRYGRILKAAKRRA